MSKITVNKNELNTSSKKFKQVASDIDQLMRKLDTELKKLDANWDGAAQDKFYSNWNTKGKKDFNAVKQQCDEFSRKLSQVAKEMDDLDRRLASQM